MAEIMRAHYIVNILKQPYDTTPEGWYKDKEEWRGISPTNSQDKRLRKLLEMANERLLGWSASQIGDVFQYHQK